MIADLLDFLLIKVPVSFRKRVVRNANNVKEYDKKVLLYYKSDPLFSKRLVSKSIHTNNIEILHMLDVFSELGISVDLVDRQAIWDDIEELSSENYDLFVSNCAGNSCPFHAEIISRFKVKKVIAYAMGPDPVLSNRLVHERHKNFELRAGVKPIVRRAICIDEKVLDARFQQSDAIIVNGDTFSFDSYKRFAKPIYYVPSTISKKVFSFKVNLNKKEANSFLYFGGSGLICKGLDIVLEAFDGLSGVKLNICGPPDEGDFWDYYGPLLKRNPHIHYHGFVEVGSETFFKIVEESTFNIFPSCSEGCATSVLTAMGVGVVPVVNYESGVNVKEFGVRIPSNAVSPRGLREIVESLRNTSKSEVGKLVLGAVEAAQEYSETSFKDAFKDAMLKELNEKNFV